MPELPEVETVLRGLQPTLQNTIIHKVELRRPNLRIPLPPSLQADITHSPIKSLGRRAKYIIIEFNNGQAVILHLGMSGRIIVVDDAAIGTYLPSPHDHVVLHLESGQQVIFRDPRRFGLITVCAREALPGHPLLKHLGPEPLEDTYCAAYLAERLQTKTMPLKTALLDQRIVAGLGNIYASEILFRAALSPLRIACSLTLEEWERIVEATRIVLREAIKAGGSTLRDHARPSGELGTFQHTFQVYNREGRPCSRCPAGSLIKRVTLSGRSTFYCTDCQG